MNDLATNAASAVNGVALSVDPTAAPALPKILSAEEAERKEARELVIKRGLETFIEVAGALGDIRDSRLYRDEYDTFEAYCREKWCLTARRAQQIMAAADVVRNIGLDANTCSRFMLPGSEAQCRPLSGMSAEDQAKAWSESVRRAMASDSRVTGRLVARVVRELKGGAAPAAAADPAPANRPATSRAAKIREQLDRSIGEVRHLMDIMRTPDSAVTAEAIEALHRLENIRTHLEKTERLQASRS